MHMGAGIAFVDDPEGARYEEAYSEFKKAYELSGSLNAQQNLAHCAMKLELDGEALELYEKFLEAKGDTLDPAERAQIEKDVNALKAATSWVTLSADEPNVMLVDERVPRSGLSIRNTYTIGLQPTKVGIHPGMHTLTASVAGKDDVVWKVELKNGSTHQYEFMFNPNSPVTADGFTEDDFTFGDKPPAEEPAPADTDSGTARPVPVYVWATAGLTVASAGAMVAFMVVAKGKNADYEDNILGQAPDADQADAQSDVETFNLLADVFIGVTAAAAVTTVLLFVMRPEAEADSTAQSGFGVDWSLVPAIGPRGGGGAIMVRF